MSFQPLWRPRQENHKFQTKMGLLPRHYLQMKSKFSEGLAEKVAQWQTLSSMCESLGLIPSETKKIKI